MENFDFLSNYNGAIEIADSRDYDIDDIVELGAGTLPEKAVLDITSPINQGSVGCCTVAGSSMCYYETYAQAINPTAYTQPYDFWAVLAEAKKRGASDTAGWAFQSALQLLVDLKKIGGYAVVNFPAVKNEQALYKMKALIASGRAIVTGSNHTDWRYVVRTGRYKEQERFSGHIYAITGYDDNMKFENGDVGGFWVPNSWGGIGSFWISYEQFKQGSFYTRYTTLLTEDAEKIAQLKNKRKTVNLQKAFDKKIWNEERPSDIATATEIRIMVNRALGLDDNYKFFRKHFAILIEDKIIRGKFQLWNNENPYSIATDNEVAIMFSRAVMRANVNELGLSREQVAEVIGRDFL